MTRAAMKFRNRVAGWTQKLAVKPRQVRIQAMVNKWASCSAAGRVTFSLDLPSQPASFQDYVIAHELLHLRIRNHGKLFLATLRAHLQGNRWLESDRR